MKSERFLALPLALVASTLHAEERAPPGLSFWVEPAARKVFADSPAGTTQAIDLAAARGEWESAQVVLRRQSAGDRLSIRAEASDLGGADTRAMPARAVEVRRVAYVPVPYAGKEFPDPLVPLRDGGAVLGEGAKDLCLIVTVRVPRDAHPGIYQGKVAVRWSRNRDATPADSKASAALEEGAFSIPLSVRVWPFEIPERPTVRTAFGISMDYALRFEGIQPDTPEAQAMHERYYWTLVDHRISPYEIPVDLLDPAAAKFLDDPRVTSFLIPYRDDLDWVRKRVERAREKGWLAKGYFYPLDEPVNNAQYKMLTDLAARIRSIDPKLRIVSPFFRDAESGKSAYDALEGLVDIWCAVSSYFRPERMEEKRKAGGEVWWYVCCGPGSPYANLHLTMDAVDHRILPWQMYKYRVEGFLYWSTTYWNPSFLKSPWVDMVTVPDINKSLSGDGSLLYPGRLPTGERISEGPVPSFRLLLLRDGFEDLEYLLLLEKAVGRTAAEEAMGKLVKDLTQFSRDPAELEKVRRQVGELISGSSRR